MCAMEISGNACPMEQVMLYQCQVIELVEAASLSSFNAVVS